MYVEMFVYAAGTIALGGAFGAFSGSRRFFLQLFAYALVLALFGCVSMYVSLSKADGLTPYLFGSDGQSYIEQARLLVDGAIVNFREVIRSNYSGFQIYLAMWFSVFGSSLAVAMLANNLLLLWSFFVLYQATALLTGSLRAGRLAALASMLTTTQIFNAFLVLKEPALGLAFALILLAAAQTLRGTRVGISQLISMSVAMLIIASMRGALLIVIPIFLLFVGRLIIKERKHLVLAFLAPFALMIGLAQSFTIYTLDVQFFVSTIASNTVLSGTLESGAVSASGIVGRVSDVFLTLPFFVKAALFVVPVSIQYLLPFDVFSTAFIDDHFASLFARNLNVVWILFVGPWVLFSVANLRRCSENAIRSVMAVGLFYYGMVAIIYGGAIPRYALPGLFFIYPAVGYWWSRAIGEADTRMRVRRFFERYYVVVMILTILYVLFSLIRVV